MFYNGGNTITGLVNNETYFVLRENTDAIKLCKYKSDVLSATVVSISTVSEASSNNPSYLAKVNPPLEFTTGNNVTFDVSDQSLLDMRLDFFDDIKFNSRLDVNGTNDDGFLSLIHI